MIDRACKNAFRWTTPDPADDWIQVGHIIIFDERVILIDPPLVPGLFDEISKLGKPEAVILTTQNHTRATAFLHKRYGLTAYLPDQDANSIDPREAVRVHDIGDYETYAGGDVLGLKAIKFGAEYCLATDDGIIAFGDNVTGDASGNIVLWPDWYTPGPPYDAYLNEMNASERNNFRNIFVNLVKETNGKTLLASHGYDIAENLQSRITDRRF